MENTQIAVIETGGKQYLVKTGDKIKVERMVATKDGKLTFTDLLDGKKVAASIAGEGRGKKVSGRIFRNKTRSSRFPQGHRQFYTELKIGKIT